MPLSVAPDLKNYLDKKLCLKLNAGRKVTGILRGYDQFMNVVVDEASELNNQEKTTSSLGTVVIRGNSIITIEPLEKIENTNHIKKKQNNTKKRGRGRGGRGRGR
mmetsp:Transcript_12817/g.19407  ORF Transcript_12817/g.19407 Transcript_12817/m.19407 type:complete len:105 (+) Transcript_12817:57-371(+)